MKLFKKISEKVSAFAVMCVATALMTILGLLVIAQTNPNPFLTWVIGALNGVVIALLLVDE